MDIAANFSMTLHGELLAVLLALGVPEKHDGCAL